jgi:hypothetical protein
LLEKAGVHDGTVEGHTYFQCEEGYGLLVKPEKLEMVKQGYALESSWHQKVSAHFASLWGDVLLFPSFGHTFLHISVGFIPIFA